MAAAGEEAESSAAAAAAAAAAEERPREPFARGGPVFIPYMVGPVCTVPEFISSALREVQSLRDELGDPGNEFEDELCVDELRVLSEEELVERALREAMEEGWDCGAPSQSADQRSATPSQSADQRSESPSQPLDQRAAMGTQDWERGKAERGMKTMVPSPPIQQLKERHLDHLLSWQWYRMNQKGARGNPEAERVKMEPLQLHQLKVEHLYYLVRIFQLFLTIQTAQMDKQNVEILKREAGILIGKFERIFYRGGILPKQRRWQRSRSSKKKTNLQRGCTHSDILTGFLRPRTHNEMEGVIFVLTFGDSAMSKGSKASAEKRDVTKSLKYNSAHSAPWKNKASKSEEHISIVSPEAILCVEIYERRHGSVKSQEFLVLGSQLLTDLKDNIYCSTNKLMELNKLHDHSGYFLIEDTFYNDMRHYSAVDYSKPVLDWLNDSSDEVAGKWDAISSGALKKRQKDLLKGLNISNVPELKSAEMESTYFSDLHFRLGAGYLYCHQGNCKHTFVIRDMRMIHLEDTQNQAEYPLMTFQMQRRLQKCSVCQIYLATKMTVDDKWAPNNPCYFCKQCYYLLHYKEDDSLLYNHSVYDYIQE